MLLEFIIHRHIDTASSYSNEQAIGQNLLLQRFTAKKDNISRGEEQAVNTVRLALKNLITNYVVLMLIHRPMDQALEDKEWARLEEAENKSLDRGIGVSNFYITHLENILKKERVVPAVFRWRAIQRKTRKTYLITVGARVFM